MRLAAALQGVEIRPRPHLLLPAGAPVGVTLRQRLLILEVSVLVVHRLAPPVALPLVQVLHGLAIRQQPPLPQVVVHLAYVVAKRFLHQLPQLAVGAVPHGLRAYRIVDFDVVRERHRALVVHAQARVVVVEYEQPAAALVSGHEHVLGPLVNHAEHQRYQVVEHYLPLVEMLLQLPLELFCVALARHHPPERLRHLLRVYTAIRVARLEVVFPALALKVRALEQRALARVVQELPALVACGEAERPLRTLVGVEVVLANELGYGIVVSLVEHHAGLAIDGRAHLGVIPLRGGQHTRLAQHPAHVVGHAGVVRARALGKVGLHAEHPCRQHLVTVKREIVRMAAVMRHGEAFPGLPLVVLPRVILRARALHVQSHALRREAPFGLLQVAELYPHRLLVALVLGQLANDGHHGYLPVQRRRRQAAVAVIHLVAPEHLHLPAYVVHVGYVVVKQLARGQAVRVAAYVVYVNRRALPLDGYACGRGLRQPVRRRVLHAAALYAVHVSLHQAVPREPAHHEGHAHPLVFLVAHRHLALLRPQAHHVRRQAQAYTAGQARQHRGIVVRHVAHGKLHLHRLALLQDVAREHVERYLGPRPARQAQAHAAPAVGHPAVRHPVHARKHRRHVAVLPFLPVGVLVAPPQRGQVQLQPLGLGLALHHAFLHVKAELPRRRAALYPQRERAFPVRPVCPRLLRAANAPLRHSFPVHVQGHACRVVFRVMHHKRYLKSLILRHLAGFESRGYYRGGIALLNANHVVA